jgi:hypothetical protein
VKLIGQCGIKISSYATFPTTDFAVDASPNDQTYASKNMAQFKSAGITTIIWAGGVETKMSSAARQIAYFPEWILAGDGAYSEGIGTNSQQDQQEWGSHAWVVTYQPYVPALHQSVCFQAYRSVDPAQATDTDVETSCRNYDQLRQVFTGIQVAGPRLGPTSIDQGFHAIPPQESFNPQVPACFYDPGDYTCIKDGTAMWWDSSATAPGGSQPGCWKASEAGKRYLTSKWPGIDPAQMRGSSDPCSTFGGTYQLQAP